MKQRLIMLRCAGWLPPDRSCVAERPVASNQRRTYRLIVEARVLLAVPPALPSFGCVSAAGVLPAQLSQAVFSASRGRRHVLGDGPDEARQLACERRRHHGRGLAGLGELAAAPARPFLRLARRAADRLGQRLLTQQRLAADPGREPALQAASTSIRRAAPWPALGMPPNPATDVAAPAKARPRSACNLRTTGASDQSASAGVCQRRCISVQAGR